MAKNAKARRIIKAIQDEKKSDKRLYAFRLSQELMVQFAKVCSKNDVSQAEVIQKLIGEFLQEGS